MATSDHDDNSEDGGADALFTEVSQDTAVYRRRKGGGGCGTDVGGGKGGGGVQFYKSPAGGSGAGGEVDAGVEIFVSGGGGGLGRRECSGRWSYGRWMWGREKEWWGNLGLCVSKGGNKGEDRPKLKKEIPTI